MKKFLTIFFGTLLSFFLLFALSHTLFASTASNLSGYAWSDNIGWIDFKGVNIDDTTGDLSGYAWSDNIGWISFNRGDTSTPPSNDPGNGAGGIAKRTGKNIAGWARALSPIGSTNAGDWDGWISLDGVSLGTATGTAFPFTGYAWGSDVVGWVDMSGVKYDTADVATALSLVPTNTDIVSGDTVDFAWSTTGFAPTSCTGTEGGSTSPYPDSSWTTVQTLDGTATSGTYSGIHVPPNDTTIFTLTCTDDVISASQSVSITAALTAGISWNSGGKSCVDKGDTPSLAWTTNDPSAAPSCKISATPSKSAAYSFSVTGAPGSVDDTKFKDETTSYSLTCTRGSGDYIATAESGAASVAICPPPCDPSKETCDTDSSTTTTTTRTGTTTTTGIGTTGTGTATTTTGTGTGSIKPHYTPF